MAEGPQPLPDPEPEPPVAAVLGRCGRHPAQPLAGVCSACLADRLSSVRTPEIVEVAATLSRSDRDDPSGSGEQGKLRKTLMLLFQMDDDDSTTTARPPDAEDPQPSSRAGPGGGANRGPKWKAGSWLRSILPKKKPSRRRAPGNEDHPRPSVEAGSVVPDPDTGGGEDATPRRPSFRRSCEWMVCRDPPHPTGSGSSRGEQPPRHSWDGSVVGRALTCSFACLDDEPSDGVTARVRRSNAEESSVGAARANGGHSADNFSGEARRSCGETGPEMTASVVGRRRSNRWSRVWDRSITSPLKEFVRKGEHALDRSASESRKDTRRCANRETADVDEEIQSRGNGGSVSGRVSKSAVRSSQANGDAVQNFRTDWLKNKECKIGRSRSVHYTSPGNYDNGMLRFYLTPMRSSRAANRGRRRSSRLFSRGLFGFV